MPAVPTPEAIELFRQGAIALARMSANGFRVDTDYLQKARETLSKRIREKQDALREHDLWKLWKKKFGSEASLNKRKQLGHLLFDVLKYECRERTAPSAKHPEGQPKVDEAAFDSLALQADANDPTIRFLKDYIRLSKDQTANGTFLGQIHDETVDGYIHTIYNLNIAESTRSTSDSPNLQNMPVRDKEQGAIIRPCFIPRHDHILEIDFSGNEIKSSYVYHKDPTFYRDITTGDMHRDTAAEIFFVDKDKVTKEMRQAAKNKFVFPQFFGDYFVNCAEGLWDEIERCKMQVDSTDMKKHLRKNGVKEYGEKFSNYDTGRIETNRGTFLEHVRQIEQSFWQDRFQVYTAWKQEHWEKYVKRGYCRMKTGFVVQGPYNRKQVINYPIQGTAFHWLLWSVIQIDKFIRKNKLKSVLVNQIHDSIILDVTESEKDLLIEQCVYIMTKAITKHWEWIDAPMEVEVELAPKGASWHEKAKVKL